MQKIQKAFYAIVKDEPKTYFGEGLTMTSFQL